MEQREETKRVQGSPLPLPAEKTLGGERVHQLKCWPPEFAELSHRYQQSQVRPADRDFQVGDTLVLREFDPHVIGDGYTGSACRAEIVGITPPGAWCLPTNLCVLDIRVKHFHRAEALAPARAGYRAEDTCPGQEEAE
jgi:hypothetical protein